MKVMDSRTERKIDRLISEIADLDDALRDIAAADDDVEPTLVIEMRDMLDAFSCDEDIPVYRRNQARDLVRNVDKELKS